MSKIIKLPENLIAKIAAGEVIERPAYAIKELIDNSLDAGATSILIDIEDSGLKKIIVSDNGTGMAREDAELALLTHTTSKVNPKLGLEKIQTLGFRGEALASIASISNIEIKTRQKGEVGGTVVDASFGKIEKISTVGTPVGTTITISNLFSNVPARKKFLSTKRTEFRNIIEIVSNYVLAFPDIDFKLTHNRKVILEYTCNHDLNNRIKKIFW